MPKELTTIKECFDFGRRAFNSAGLDSAEFECQQLLTAVFGIRGIDVVLKGNVEPNQSDIFKFKELVASRISGAPLQYLIGEWDFYNLTFKVGEGVLIPRPETELIVDKALEFLNGNTFDNDNKANVLDLCAGTGCIGITVADNYNNCHVTEIEKSESAYKYLKVNIEYNKASRVKPILGDITQGYEELNLGQPLPDLILSNPPYIKSKEIETLQCEVQSEPKMALDGGEDGFDFYKIITDKWLPFLAPGGMILVECGEEQAEYIEEMFSIYCGETFKIKDFRGTYRIVGAKKV